jgi:hypothetical protein
LHFSKFYQCFFNILFFGENIFKKVPGMIAVVVAGVVDGEQ